MNNPPKQAGDGEYDRHLEAWIEMDKMLRFKWWSPLYLIQYYLTTKRVAREVRKRYKL